MDQARSTGILKSHQEFASLPMFSLFRSREKSQKVLLSVLLGLVAVSMLIYLIPGGYGGGSGADSQNVVAKVGDQDITVQDVQRDQKRRTLQIERACPGITNYSLLPDMFSQKCIKELQK